MNGNFRKFLLLWSGELVSSIGGGLTSFGLTVYVFNQTGSAASTALVAFLAFIPLLLLGVPAGVLADRFDRRIMMMLGDGLSAIGLIYILFCMLNGGAELWQICIGVAISSSFSALMDPAYRATVSDLLTEEEYAKASGLVSLAGSARYLISPFLAGMLLAVWDVRLLLVIDICTFVLTVTVTFIVRSGLKNTVKEKTTSFMEDFRIGWKTVSGNKGILLLLVMAAIMTACMGAIQILAEPMVLAFESSQVLGITETICACGMMVTSIVIGMKGMHKGFVKALSLSLAGAGLFMVLFGMKENLVLIGISGFLFFAMIPIANTSLDYLVRTNIANELQGRAWGIISFISQLGYVFAYGLGGVFADAIARSSGISVGRGSGEVIMIAGAALVVVALVFYSMKSIRTLEKPVSEV